MQIEVITGATASGKTALVLERAAADPKIEIVNADAFQLYRHFDIGTAKPSKRVQESIPHHLIDILDATERYTAAEYSRAGQNAIRDIISRGNTPIVVGGTGFYIDALFFGISGIDVSEDVLEEARNRYKQEFKELGYEKMFNNLLTFDPSLYKQVEREKNPIRMKRAYEHFYASGIPLGVAREMKPEPFEHEPKCTVMNVPREELHQRIEVRIDEMLALGWLGEVKRLLESGITTEMPAMRAIGYKELADVATERMDLIDARKQIIIRTRQYAKRQVTWMKRYK